MSKAVCGKTVWGRARVIFGVMVAAFFSALVLSGCSFPDEDDDGNGGGGGGGGTNGKPTITIKNNTGYDIVGSAWGGGIWIKPSSELFTWEGYCVGGCHSENGGYSDNYLSDGNSIKLELSQPLSNGQYDVMLRRSNGNFVKYGITIQNGAIVTFTISDLSNGKELPTISIQNRTGKDFNSIHIKPSVLDDWGKGADGLGNNGDRFITIFTPPSNYSVFDIQTRSSNPTNTYTINNVTIADSMTLLFTSANADNPTVELPVVIIQNNTGCAVGNGVQGGGGVYIRPSNETLDWGSNLNNCCYYHLPDGTSKAYTLNQDLSSNDVYDIRLQSNTGCGGSFEKYNVTVSEGIIITINPGDIKQ